MKENADCLERKIFKFARDNPNSLMFFQRQIKQVRIYIKACLSARNRQVESITKKKILQDIRVKKNNLFKFND